MKHTAVIRTILLSVITLSTLFFVGQLLNTPVFSDQLSDYQQQLDQIAKQKAEKEKILSATNAEINKINQSGASLNQKIAMLDANIKQTEASIVQSEEDLKQKEIEIEAKQKILDERKAKIGVYATLLYKNARVGVLETVLSMDDPENILQSISYRKYILQDQMDAMKVLNGEYAQLNQDKADIQANKENLAAQKSALEDSKAGFEAQKVILQQQYAQQAAAQAKLNAEISSLATQVSTLQKQIAETRAGLSYIDISSVPSTGEFNQTLAGFRQNAPYGSYAVFSIGAYTHRNGMSQYGALARATAGQTAEQILQAYYPNYRLVKDYNIEGINISVYGKNDYGQVFTGETYDLNTYVKHIYEVPSSWNVEVLKAQAITARSYALARTGGRSGSICPSQSCQEAKFELNGQAWQNAVDATATWMLVDANGRPVSTQYASTHGGWVNNVGWDTIDGSGSGQNDWMAKAWEVKAGHPWFYRSWYRQSYSDSSATCGRNPWLTEEEMADILNTYLIKNNIDVINGPDGSRLIPVTIQACPVGAATSTVPYSMAEVRTFVNNPVTKITARPVVVNDNSGNSSYVVFETNRGRLEISAAAFKTTFNIRAPGYLRIPQSGFAFFNVEMK